VTLADYSEEQLGLSRTIAFCPLCGAVRPVTVATPVLVLFAGDDEVAPSRACQVSIEKSANPGSAKAVTYHRALHAFDVREIPEGTRGSGGAMGYNAQSAIAAWQEVQRFLNAAK